jgi:two-component system sensor histidine kinase YesM
VYSGKIEAEITESNYIETTKIRKSVDLLQKDIKDLSTFIVLDSELQKALTISQKSMSVNTTSEYNHMTEVLSPLYNLVASKDYISFIAIYGKNGFTYYISSDGSNGLRQFSEIQSLDIYSKAENLRGAFLWKNLDSDNQMFIINNKFPKVAMIRSLISTNNYENIGFMVICLNITTLDNLYSENTKSSKRSVILLDEQNNLISLKSSDDNLKTEDISNYILPAINERAGKKNISLGGENYLITYDTTEQSSWKIIYTVPVNELLRDLKSVLVITIIVVLGCLVIALILAMFISTYLTSPINKLIYSMEKVKQGNFKEKVNFKYNDEIGILGEQYNDMIDNINNLIGEVYMLQIQEKEAELKALQAQINPHFLYNTLDSIFWKAQKSNDKEIGEMIHALSKLFRLTLNRGHEFTDISNEKDFIHSYLLLQKLRYGDKLDYSLDFDETILFFRIPKLILQPFVENSIAYGTEYSNTKSIIRVTGEQHQQGIRFTIKDNGSGISEELIEKIQADDMINVSNGSTGYAMKNVRKRLSLYYDNNFVFNIFSSLGEGTTIEIIIPTDCKKFLMEE